MIVEKVDGLNLLVLTGVPGPTLTESLMGGNGVSDWSGLGHQCRSLRSTAPRILGKRVLKCPKTNQAVSDETEWMLGRHDPIQPTKELEETRGQLFASHTCS